MREAEQARDIHEGQVLLHVDKEAWIRSGEEGTGGIDAVGEKAQQ